MPRALSCADCAQPMHSTTGSLPQGHARCQPCRRARPVLSRPKCRQCGSYMAAGATGARACRKCAQWSLRTCEVCSSSYKPTYGAQRTCGRVCGRVLSSRSRRPKRGETCNVRWHECLICLKPISRPGVDYCSPTCRLVRYGSKAKPTTVPCADCGEDYSTKTAANGGVCKDCQKRAFRARFGSSDRKRARYYQVAYEPIDRLRVYERDGWICGICEEPVLPDERSPHPLSPSLDHIIPISRGGDHLYGNVQCAHFLCNSLKGNRLDPGAVAA